MSLLSDLLEGSQHPQRGRQCGEAGAHMKINLPIFKDKDAKDAVTYQIWRWDLMVYPRELVWGSWMDITLDDVLMILTNNIIM